MNNLGKLVDSGNKAMEELSTIEYWENALKYGIHSDDIEDLMGRLLQVLEESDEQYDRSYNEGHDEGYDYGYESGRNHVYCSLCEKRRWDKGNEI